MVLKTLTVMDYGVWLKERGILHLKRTNLLENRGLSDRGEMAWGRSDRLPLKVIICLSMGLPNWIMQTTLTIVTVI